MSPSDGTFNSVTEGVTKALTRGQFSALSDGSHTIYVHGKDAANNWGATASATFTKDTTPPTVSVTAPANGAFYHAAAVPSPFTGDVADNTGGVGLNPNSTSFTLQRASDNRYWNPGG